MIIAVDFDGTIVTHQYPKIGEPVPFAFEVLKQLSDEGHKLILWTYREGRELKEAVAFCRKNGLEFYAVNSEYPDDGWTDKNVSRKIHADVYIDDKNFGGLPDWTDIYAKLGTDGKLIMAEPKQSLLARISDRCRDVRAKFEK